MPVYTRATALLIASIAWSAVLLQYVLLLAAAQREIGTLLATLRFFSFFTIQCNIAVALATTFAAARHAGAAPRFFERPRVRAGIALCIAIVCAIYHVLLAATWAPQGLQRVVDIALHYVVPLLYVGWWVATQVHGRLAWSDALRWLAFPAAFLAWSLARGAWVHEYPYPFIDVDALGYTSVLRNAVGIAGLFLGLGLVVVAIDRLLARRTSAMEPA